MAELIKIYDKSNRLSNNLKKDMINEIEILVEPESVGYAIVAWDAKGNLSGSMQAGEGMVSPDLAVVLVNNFLIKFTKLNIVE